MSEQNSPSAAAGHSILCSLRSSPSNNGLTQMGSDGVFRSFSSTGHVVDYKKLDPDQINNVLEAFIDTAKLDSDPKAIGEKFKGVDGRDVSDHDAENPARETIPKHLLDKRDGKETLEKGIQGRASSPALG